MVDVEMDDQVVALEGQLTAERELNDKLRAALQAVAVAVTYAARDLPMLRRILDELVEDADHDCLLGDG